jgi:hypothetical protein
MIRGVIATLVLMALSGTAGAGEPFHGHFQPSGGAYYSPLHFWAPALYRVRFYCKGPECPLCPGTAFPASGCVYNRPQAVSPAATTPSSTTRTPSRGSDGTGSPGVNKAPVPENLP